MEALFDAVRNAAGARVWSRGIELVRAGAVIGVSASEQEVVCQVRLPRRVAASKVTLYPVDAEWDCDCGSRDEVCECVAAATIATKRAREAGAEMPQLGATQGRVTYRFCRREGSLTLERWIVRGDNRTQKLEQSLARFAQANEYLSPTQTDLHIERLLSSVRVGSLSPELLQAVLELLSDAPDVQLDGERVAIASGSVAPRGRVTDSGDGVRVSLEAHPSVREVLAPGVVLAGNALCRLSHTDVTGLRLERLPEFRDYAREQLMELVTEVLPGLLRRFEFAIQSTRLPKTSHSARPRLLLDVDQQGHRLSVLGTLVYGDPPVARVDAGKLVYLGGDVPVRDEESEKALIARARDHLNLVTGRRVTLEGDAAAAFAARLDAWNGEIRGNRPAKFLEEGELVPKLNVAGTAFELSFENHETGKRASAEALLSAWQQGASVVPLLDGGWAPLPHAWLDKYGERVAALLAARNPQTGEVASFATLELAQLCQDLDSPLSPRLEQLAPLLGSFEGIPEAELPPDLRAELRDYQREGFKWLCFLRDHGLGAVLADDMGLGKTLQALCAVRGRTLVVCPRSVVFNWVDELKKFRPTLSHDIYHGPNRRLDPEADVTLTTYALLRLDRAALSEIKWDSIVLDEAQNIKNPDSQASQAAFALQGDFKLALSGTPVENRLEELWSELHFVNPGLLGGRQSFRDTYATPIALGRQDVAQRLRQRIRPFLLRRLKSAVAKDLPPRTEMVLHCELTEQERETYQTIQLATRKEVLAELDAGGSVMAAFEALLRLRQAACHGALLPGHRPLNATGPETADESARATAHEATTDGETAAQAPQPLGARRSLPLLTPSSKVERLLAELEVAADEGHKSLIFSQWTSLLDLVEPHLALRGISHTRLDGSTRDRAEVVNTFQAPDGPHVMLLSLKAGGTGLNLTAADYVFLLDPWWNPAAEDQAADRAHRIGQDKPVIIYRLVARDTVEERILVLQEHKRELAKAALGEAYRAVSLTRDDLRQLLE